MPFLSQAASELVRHLQSQQMLNRFVIVSPLLKTHLKFWPSWVAASLSSSGLTLFYLT